MIYLLRHGETEFNREGRIQGWLHSDLTDLGLRQAERMGDRLGALIQAPEDWVVISSPQGRAVRTAEIVRQRAGISAPLETVDGLKEVTLGSWEGSLYDDIEATFPEAFIGSTRYDRFFRSPDGDTYDSLAARVAEGLAAVQRHPTPNRIIVSHGVAGRLIRGFYANLPKEQALKLEAPQTAFFRLHEGRIERIACDGDEG
ncbi:MAG: histidine phosphatase family protein [Caulobacteraceae bacterium]